MVERRNRIAAAVCDFCRAGALLLFRFHDRCDISTFWLAWTLGLQRCFHTAHQYGGVARHVVRLVDSDVELVDTASATQMAWWLVPITFMLAVASYGMLRRAG